MRRREMIGATLAVLIAGPGALAQTPGRTYVVAYWGIWAAPGKPPDPTTRKTPPRIAWFEDELAKHGFIVGKNTRIEYVFTGHDTRDLIALQAKELVAKKPDVIWPRLGVVEEKRRVIRALTPSIPVVVDNVVESVALEFVGDLKRPAGNVTGVALNYAEFAEKRLELIRQLLPKARRVAVIADFLLYSPNDFARLEGSARRLGLEIVRGDVARHGGGFEATPASGTAALDATLAAVLKARPDAFMAYGSFNAPNRGEQFLDFELKHRIPFIDDGHTRRSVVGFGMDYEDHLRRAVGSPRIEIARHGHGDSKLDPLAGDRSDRVAMDRTRRKLIGGGTLALCWPATVLAQDPKRIARVVIAQKISEKSRELFRAEFAKHDWVEGRNLAMSSVDIVNAPKAEAEARAREVVAGRPDAILMLPGAEMALFKRLTNDIPVVFYNLAIDPSKIGLVESLRRPGGNFTGTSHNYELLNTKAWAMLKEIHPAMKRGGSLGEKNSDNDFYKAFPKAESIDQESMKSAARFLGIEIREIIVPKDATFAMVVEAIRKPKPDALMIDWNLTKIPGLMAFLEKAGILTCGTLEVVRNGGLLALTFDFSEGAKQAVAIVARILRGESPATIPVYQGTRYGLALNLRTARAMRLTIPASIRVQATEVIE